MRVTNKIRGLDGLRGLAVIAVILTHMDIYGAWLREGALNRYLLAMISGDAGVHVFFVLSGFLITLLLVRETQATGRVSIRDFYMRRALRIFPLYFLLLFLVLILEIIGRTGTSERAFIYAFTYIYNFIPRAYHSSVLGHTWSLAVEEHYYLIWPFVFSAFFLRRKSIFFLGSLVALAICVYLQGAGLIDFRDGYFVNRWTMTAGTSILVGSLFGAMMSSQETWGWLVRVLRSRLMWVAAALLYSHTLWVGSLPYGLSRPARAIAVGLFLVYLFEHQDELVANVLDFRPLSYLGMISYDVYIWQGFFLSTGPDRFAGQTWPPDNQWIGLALLVLVAPLSYHVLQKPILRYRRRFSARRAVVAPDAADPVGAQVAGGPAAPG